MMAPQSLKILALCILFNIHVVLALSPSSTRSCTDYSIPVTVTSDNYIWGLPKFQNNYDVVDWITNFGSLNSTNFQQTVEGGLQNQTESYVISATLCTPTNLKAPKKDIVLLATHGLNFDRLYWDSAFKPGKYSFVDFAIGQGYSIFFYDRLGVSKSTVVSGYVAQASIQMAILKKLAQFVKAGKYTGSIGVPKSLVLVGHSFGSVLSAAVATAYPDISDGLVLTGFSYNGSNAVGFMEGAQPRIASTQNSSLWGKLDTGYLLPIDIFSNVQTFFKKPDYEVEAVKYADANKQPFAIQEFFTLGLAATEATSYKGVAMIVTGEFDYIFCTSDCPAVLAHPATEIFANAKAFTATSYPGAGHGLNFAANAVGAYKIITDFLGSHGL